MDAGEMQKLFEQATGYENVAVPKGEMSPLQRFNAIMEYKPFDRMIDTEFGYWDETLRRWHKEGLPDFVTDNAKADVFFGFDVWKKHVSGKVNIHPVFKQEVLQDDGRHKIILNSERVKCEIFSDGKDSIPHYIDFPVKDRASYQAFKERLNPADPERIPSNIREIGQKVKDRNYVLAAYGGSTAGWVRNWMGFEGIAMAIYDQPELLDEIVTDIGNVSAAVAGAITAHMTIDVVSWWEDIAFKNGPIVTPDFFINKCGPVIGKVMSVYREKGGCKYGYVDCDGDLRRLVPGWLNNGVNIMFPLEVASGIHPENLRKEYPGVRMMGGVDKTVMNKGKDAIKKEMKRLKALADEGGFIPHVDHRVQADISYKDYLLYLEIKRDIFGIPNTVHAR